MTALLRLPKLSVGWESVPALHASHVTQCFSTSAFRSATHVDHYGALKLPRNASKAQIKARFYELSKKHHPDAPGGNSEKFHKINDAYAVLGEDNARRQYDARTAPASTLSGSSHTFHPHSPQARRAAGPHRAWGGRAPPPPQWHGRRKVDPHLGFGMGMGSGPAASGSASPRWGRRETNRRAATTRNDEDVKGESPLWRFVVVVTVLFTIMGLGGGFTASAEGCDTHPTLTCLASQSDLSLNEPAQRSRRLTLASSEGRGKDDTR